MAEERDCRDEADESSNSERAGLHQRIRDLGGGLALGSESFVEQVFRANQQRMRVKRLTGARVPPSKHGLGPLRTLLDLRGTE
ncbi:MAG: hypothetical protein R3F19_27095 [Verrucomicrobiales bacterium]